MIVYVRKERCYHICCIKKQRKISTFLSFFYLFYICLNHALLPRGHSEVFEAQENDKKQLIDTLIRTYHINVNGQAPSRI